MEDKDDLTGSANKEQEAVDDSILESLSTMAYENSDSLEVIPEVGEKPRHKSRFFFRMAPSFASEVASKKKKFVPKQMKYIDQEVTDRLGTYKNELTEELRDHIEKVREFFLTTVGPKALAGGAGAAQAKEIVQRLLNTEIDNTQFERFQRMNAKAVDIVMAKFIATYYELPVNTAYRILAEMQPKQPFVIPVPQPAEARNEKAKVNKDKGAGT